MRYFLTAILLQYCRSVRACQALPCACGATPAPMRPQVSGAAAAGRLEELTVPELKCWLRARRAKLKGKKADLVARVAARLTEEEEV